MAESKYSSILIPFYKISDIINKIQIESNNPAKWRYNLIISEIRLMRGKLVDHDYMSIKFDNINHLLYHLKDFNKLLKTDNTKECVELALEIRSVLRN